LGFHSDSDTRGPSDRRFAKCGYLELEHFDEEGEDEDSKEHDCLDSNEKNERRYSGNFSSNPSKVHGLKSEIPFDLGDFENLKISTEEEEKEAGEQENEAHCGDDWEGAEDWKVEGDKTGRSEDFDGSFEAYVESHKGVWVLREWDYAENCWKS
jgi:hypothetical protein